MQTKQRLVAIRKYQEHPQYKRTQGTDLVSSMEVFGGKDGEEKKTSEMVEGGSRLSQVEGQNLN